MQRTRWKLQTTTNNNSNINLVLSLLQSCPQKPQLLLSQSVSFFSFTNNSKLMIGITKGLLCVRVMFFQESNLDFGIEDEWVLLINHFNLRASLLFVVYIFSYFKILICKDTVWNFYILTGKNIFFPITFIRVSFSFLFFVFVLYCLSVRTFN